MKVAITAESGDWHAAVDQRFGRARVFVVVDTETGALEAHDNLQNRNAAQGAGIQAAQAVSQLGVEALVTGNVGPKAFAALQAAGIQIYLADEGTVAGTIENFKAGALPEAGRATVPGHWT